MCHPYLYILCVGSSFTFAGGAVLTGPFAGLIRGGVYTGTGLGSSFTFAGGAVLAGTFAGLIAGGVYIGTGLAGPLTPPLFA
jgi:hypothetical protein